MDEDDGHDNHSRKRWNIFRGRQSARAGFFAIFFATAAAPAFFVVFAFFFATAAFAFFFFFAMAAFLVFASFFFLLRALPATSLWRGPPRLLGLRPHHSGCAVGHR